MKVKDTLGLPTAALEGRERAGSVARSGSSLGTQTDGGARDTDRVVLSARSREAAQVREALSAVPETRAQMVAEIKSRVDNQEYQVDPEKVAQKMILSCLGELT